MSENLARACVLLQLARDIIEQEACALATYTSRADAQDLVDMGSDIGAVLSTIARVSGRKKDTALEHAHQ